MHLLDIYLLFSALSALQSDNRRKFCNKPIGDLKKTWPEPKIVHDKPRHNQRREAKECLEIQAAKMKSLSDKSYSAASVGTTFCIPVPEVDRERGNDRSVLAVVMENTGKGFFQLGTKDGRRKQLH
ncbi:hypothetical protein TNCV_2495271 [Trichonephila clavipes]|nr:hypothetical protein TNCV_2495271 [Trichonephila clavipes]